MTYRPRPRVGSGRELAQPLRLRRAEQARPAGRAARRLQAARLAGLPRGRRRRGAPKRR